MQHPTDANLTLFQRRHARRMAVWNAAVWAIGNGLASTTLITYLARELHSDQLGIGISFILAAPHLVGALRAFTPMMMRRIERRKRFCIISFLIGALLLLAIPWLCRPSVLPSPGWSLATLILLWCLYHLLQYLGTVALWSWLADIASIPIRGHFLGWRERWLVGGQVAATLAAAALSWALSQSCPNLPPWIPYATLGSLGAMCMIASLLPLVFMPPATPHQPSIWHEHWSDLRKPFTDARFLRLLLFGCWFSFFNGITQTAQNYYPMQVLGISLALSLSLQTGMRLGQLGISPKLGKLADRYGNRGVLIVSQLLVAAGLLCFAMAVPDRWVWIVGAWILWIAYAGMNICLPNLLLRVSPGQNNTPHIAIFYAISGLCYAVSTLLGGTILEYFRNWETTLGGHHLTFFPCLFIAGWFARSLGVLFLHYIIEPTGRDHAASGPSS